MSTADEGFDAMCDPNNPRAVSFADVTAAAFRIRSGIKRTPCVPSHMSEDCKMNMYLKCDFMQYTGSFKERGARNAILRLDAEVRKRGVFAASTGNHSQAMGYHGRALGVPTTVVMPHVAPLVKIEKCRSFGANVVIHGETIMDARLEALKLTKQAKGTYINGYDHPDVIAGQGTVGLEILSQVPAVDAVLVPVGGGGLLAGIVIAIKHLKPECLVYGIETDKCASMATSLKAGKIVNYEITRTLADGLAVGIVGCNSFFNIKPLVDKMVVVTEDWTARALLHIVEYEKYIVEGAGATAVAACMSGVVPELQGKNVVCILSGGNIDTVVLSVSMGRGLVFDQRLIKFKVNIAAGAGSLAELTTLLASIGVSVKEINQERIWIQGTIFSTRVKLVCETRGPAHVTQLRDLMVEKYKECDFMNEHVGTGTGDRPRSSTTGPPPPHVPPPTEAHTEPPSDASQK